MEPIKILFLTDNFPPEGNAPANRTYEHCIEWVKMGAEVTVITCHPNFPKGQVFDGYKNSLYKKEDIDGIKVIRVWSYITQNRGTIKRILDYISFGLTSFFASFFHKTDVIVATSPQLFTAVAGFLVSKVKQKPWIMEVRDLWPESIKAVDAISSSSVLDRLQVLVDFLYRKADGIVVVTESFKNQLSKIKGVKEKKIDIIKNGVNRNRFFVKAASEALISQLKLEGKFIVGYVGTHGMAHNLDFIMDCAKKIEDSTIHFLFIGDGAFKGRLLKKLEDDKIINVTMLDPVNRDEIHEYLSIINVSLIPLKKSDTFKSVIPSKIFENAAMGKPILLGVEGEAKQIVEKYAAGLCFEPENENDFIEKLTSIKQQEKLYQELSNGGLKLAAEFNREKLASKMMESIHRAHERRMKFYNIKYSIRDGEKHKKRKQLVRIVDFILFALVCAIIYLLIV